VSDAGAALDAFLAAAGTTRAEVVAAVTARLGLDPADRLLAAGSVVEGLGSRKSDLDLLLLTSADAGTADQVALVVGRCVVEVRVVRPAALRALLDRFAAWRAGPWDVSREAGFGPQEHRLLHRLWHSLALHGDRPDGMPTVADLARLKLHNARQTARTVQVDLVGYREAGDHRTLVYAAQDLLGLAVDALTARHGLTNPVAKWRSRLLDRLPPDWAADLPLRPSPLPAAERVWALHRAPEHPEPAAAHRHALAATTFARAVLAGTEHQLLTGRPLAPFPRPAAAGGEASPWLDLDVDYVLGDPILLGRLNEPGPPVALSPAALPTALLDPHTLPALRAAGLTVD
jgi:hypothetical protein